MKVVAIYLCVVSVVFLVQGNMQLGIITGVMGCFAALNEYFSE